MKLKSARAEGRRKVTLGPTHSSKWSCSSGDHPFISRLSHVGRRGEAAPSRAVIICSDRDAVDREGR